ncbi:AH receptor-interacting protein [Halotydeus destructor]|nr:AH receptor-interacting protein [Halotydeus destructor]
MPGATTKKILYVGNGMPPDFPKGTKATFHFKTFYKDELSEEIVLDDSRKNGKPMELLMGKQFKLPVLEEFIKTMRTGEVSHFTAIKPLVANYPFISKAYRKFSTKDSDNHHSHEDDDQSSGHCCGMTLQQKGLGYEDLDKVLKNPVDLEFIIELLKVESPEQYEKESWEMEHEERITAIPRLKDEGNEMYKQGNFELALEKYGQAIGIVEQLLLREKPGDEDWNVLDNLKVPLYANYAQCKMLLKDYYGVIEYTNEVLKRDPRNVKCLFRRAKAHSLVWNTEEAKKDFDDVVRLDASLEKSVLKEVKAMELREKAKAEQEKQIFKGKIF